MSEPFDPYSQWLGIEPHEMPVDHYRLLGIERFESDPAVIMAAADERMRHVRSFQTGPRAAHTQKLLNELAAARVCLLNPGAKANYDHVLEAVFFSSAAPPRFAQVASPPLHSGENTEEEPEEEEEEDELGLDGWSWAASLAATAVIIVLLVGAIGMVALRLRERNRQPAQTNLAPSSRIQESLLEVPEYDDVEPVLIYQEADGSVNLDASFAELHGPTLRLGISGNVNVITNWESMDDWVSWTFKVVKLPPQGIFHVHVTYAARPESDGGTFVIAISDQEKECEIRGAGEPVTDEYFLAVPNSGEYMLTVRAKSKPAQRLMTLKSVNFRFP